ncbi:dienelactone hydrolase family protein [Roseicyclus mahoneyensis]|jgi:carboxymethylenebutenolidase|uniref:Carboxymethylenebutenolidase n=1 Tax=Roseicyclus mahoneyensis TaxID=164332 RepID=A0A316GFN3_9RHOB|nr:dienelactone hydrolase family protein [Roseicyclus mahoneyensis]PWK58180.1 carboxymethylenebutenolidase [Roseicyclus mahoneyensis]
MMTELTAADGHRLDGWIEPAIGARKGGLMILQEIFGVTDQLKGVARHYAALGYEVAIPALFDRHEKGAVIPFDQGSRGRDMMLASDLDQTMLDADAAVQALAKNGGKVGVIGFCWGGGLALRAAQVLDVGCAVAFYGTRLTQYLDRPLKAPFMAHFGSLDDHVPPEMREAAKAALPGMEVHLYDAGHAFANDARPSHVPAAANTAHARTRGFLALHIR